MLKEPTYLRKIYGFTGCTGDKRPKTRPWACRRCWDYNPAQGWKTQRAIPSKNRLEKKKSPGPTQGDMQILVSFSLDFGIEGIKTFPLEFVTTNFPSHGFESSNL